jgi:hypothetical protein
MSNQLRSALQFLRQQFEKRTDKSLCCCLVEYPVMGKVPETLPPVAFLNSTDTYKWEPQGTPYRSFDFAKDQPVPKLADAGARRALYFSGPQIISGEFLRLAGEAGKLLNDVPWDSISPRIPSETILSRPEAMRWCFLLFDLAWAAVKNSPLHASEKRAWHGADSLPLAELPAQRLPKLDGDGKEYPWSSLMRQTAAQFLDPPSWFSIIGDLWRASVYTSDILLAGMEKRPMEVEPNGNEAVLDADRYDWVSAKSALDIVRHGAYLVEQLAHRPAEDAVAFIQRQSAAVSAWRLERLVNLGHCPHADRRRGRNGRPATVCVAIWKLCERLTELYEFLHWQEVCTDPDGPENGPLTGHEHRPWWLPPPQSGFRPPDVPEANLHGLQTAIAEMARAARYAYPGEPEKTATALLQRLQPIKEPSGVKEEPPETCRHSDDFRSVTWFGKKYTFTENQAPRVKLLWENWKRGTPDVGRQILLDAAESSAEHVSHVFRDCLAWGTIIVSIKRGSYRLQEPSDAKGGGKPARPKKVVPRAVPKKKTRPIQQKRT